MNRVSTWFCVLVNANYLIKIHKAGVTGWYSFGTEYKKTFGMGG